MSTTRLGDHACDSEKHMIDARLERMQPGARIKIRYEPSNPGRAIVYRAALDLVDYLFPVPALILFAGGIKAIREAEAKRAR